MFYSVCYLGLFSWCDVICPSLSLSVCLSLSLSLSLVNFSAYYEICHWAVNVILSYSRTRELKFVFKQRRCQSCYRRRSVPPGIRTPNILDRMRSERSNRLQDRRGKSLVNKCRNWMLNIFLLFIEILNRLSWGLQARIFPNVRFCR